MIKLEEVKPDKLVDIITYFAVLMLGIVIVILSFGNINNYLDFMTNLFYILTLIFMVSYFMCRKYQNYEKLFLALSSAVITGYLFFLRNSTSVLLLGTSLFIYIILVVSVKSVSMIKLHKKKKNGCQSKVICILFLALIGISTGIILTSQLFYHVLIYGYFFMVFGIVCLFEPILCILSKDQ